MNLEDVLTQAGDRSSVHITLVSNQDNGIASYAVGDLIFHPGTDGLTQVHGQLHQPAHMASATDKPLRMFFSYRMRIIDPPPAEGQFGRSPRQPFDADATEPLGMSVSPKLGYYQFGDNQTISVQITVFGNTSTFDMKRQGNLFVGVGPQFGGSLEADYILAFTGVTHPPA